MAFGTIRLRLTLWFALSLAVVLAASGLFWRVNLERNLLRHVDERILTVAEDISSYLLEGKTLSEHHDDCEGLENFIRIHNWAGYVQIQNERGTVTCTSSNLQKFSLPLSKATLQLVNQGLPNYETIPGNGPFKLRLLTFPSREENRVTHLLQVAESLAPMQHTLDDFSLVLLVFSPLAVLILAFGGWFLASRALAPVSRIIHAAQRISAKNLSERLPVGKSRDEITQLAETFNSVLTRLEEAFRKIRQFSGDASHELRTPLTILKGETEVALLWAKTPEEFRKILESNLEEVDRMGRMIENLLTLAKSDAGEMHLERRLFSLSDMLQHLYLQTKTLGDAKGVDIRLALDVAEEIRLVGDELRLRQVFLNLITNAIKYTPTAGWVEVGLTVDGEDALITVSDSGIGIAAEHHPYIFDRFYRIDKARNREDGGSGLGLAIVKWIVIAHEGEITVNSQYGSGSTFSVRLPLAGPQQRDSGSS